MNLINCIELNNQLIKTVNKPFALYFDSDCLDSILIIVYAESNKQDYDNIRNLITQHFTDSSMVGLVFEPKSEYPKDYSFKEELRQHIIEQIGIDDIGYDVETIINNRAEFISNYLNDNKINDVILGISGGIDSYVAGKICQYANDKLRDIYNPIRLHLISMPNHNQNDIKDVEDSVEDIHPYEFIDFNIGTIADIFKEEFTNICSSFNDQHKLKYIFGNMQARVRMIGQYMFAQLYNGVVIGTDHASESLTGFYTKYGDGGTDINPLAGLRKSTIVEIAKWFNGPENVINKKPSAGLGISNTDEEELGVTYQDIEHFLTDGQNISDQAFNRIIHLFNRSKHKRMMPVTP